MSPVTCLCRAVLSRQQPRTDLVVTSKITGAPCCCTSHCCLVDLWLMSRYLSLPCACHVLLPLFACSWLKRAYNRTFHAVTLCWGDPLPHLSFTCSVLPPLTAYSRLRRAYNRVCHVHALGWAGAVPHLPFTCRVLPPLTAYSRLRRAYSRLYHAVAICCAEKLLHLCLT